MGFFCRRLNLMGSYLPRLAWLAVFRSSCCDGVEADLIAYEMDFLVSYLYRFYSLCFNHRRFYSLLERRYKTRALARFVMLMVVSAAILFALVVVI